jgi:hypothetical protein
MTGVAQGKGYPFLSAQTVKEFYMDRKFKVIAIAVITALALAVFPLAAQTSNASRASAGRFGTDVDDYMGYFSYSGVQFDKFFSFLGVYQEKLDTLPGLQMGYARRFGGLYLGAYYTGTILRINKAKQEVIDPSYDGNGNLTGQTETTDYWGNVGFPVADPYSPGAPQSQDPSDYIEFAEIYAANSADILVGVAGMGIKVGFKEELWGRTNPRTQGIDHDGDGGDSTATPPIPGTDDIRTPFGTITKNGVANQELDTYSFLKGTIKPKLGWGMPITLGSVTLKPKVEAAVDIHQDREEYVLKTTNISGGVVTSVGTTETGHKAGYIQPDILVGAEVAFANNLALGLEYNIKFDIYRNKYDVFGQSDTAKGTVAWDGGTSTVTEYLNRTVESNQYTLSFSDKKHNEHLITPALAYSTDLSDRLKLGFKAEFPVSLSFSTEDEYRRTYNETLTTYSAANSEGNTARSVSETEAYTGKTKTNEWGIGSTVKAGIRYALIPSRINLNTGIIVDLVNYTRKTERTEPNGVGGTSTVSYDGWGNLEQNSYAPNNNVADDELEVTSDWAFPHVTLTAGFTFNLTPGFAIDTALVAPDIGMNSLSRDFTQLNVQFTWKK